MSQSLGPPPLFAHLPSAVRFMLLHGAIGFGIAALFVAALVVSDAGGLATLLYGAETHPWPLLLLWFFSGLTFGSVQIGAAVMLMDHDDDPPGGGRRGRVPLSGMVQPAMARAPIPRARRR